MNNTYLYHHGIKNQKWGVRRYQNPDGTLTAEGRKRYGNDITIAKGSEIHRIIPKDWAEKEKTYTGHAYASFIKEDTDRYKQFAKMFGQQSSDMTFKTMNILKSPSMKRRVDEFVTLMNTNEKARSAMIKSSRGLFNYIPKKYFDKLDNDKTAEKVYQKFAYLLVCKPDLRDPYFKQLSEAGYNMIIDDADVRGGISKQPIIVFERQKMLELQSIKDIE